MIVVSGPSGVGKSTICNMLLRRRNDLWFSISATSRPPRKGERSGHEYHFISRRSFEHQITKNRFVEYAEVHGNLYGTPRAPLENAMIRGKNVLLEIDVQGAKKIMGEFADGIFIFLMPPRFTDLQKRLGKRNTDGLKEINQRLTRAQKEIAYKKDYKYVVENRTVAQTLKTVLGILENEIGAFSQND